MEEQSGRILIEKVKKYYILVDKEEFDEMFDLFSDDIFYLRCDHEIKGKDDFKKFYYQGRKIKGKHKIIDLLCGSNIVSVRGVFSGTNNAGDVLTINFADFFYFDENNKISERHTYLAQDSKQIE